MSRNNIFLLLLLIGLGVAGYFAYDLMNSDKNEEGAQLCDMSEEELGKQFAIKDTAKVDKIIITDTRGSRAVVYRTDNGGWEFYNEFASENGTWKAGNKMKARDDAANMILKTFHNVELQNFVPNQAKENIMKGIIASHSQVDIYMNGKLEKTWYVGMTTQDHYGTYMLIELPGCGRSKWPFIMEARAHHGHLTSRFFTEEKEWRYKGIWEMDVRKLKSVEVNNYVAEDQSYKIEIDGDSVSLYNKSGELQTDVIKDNIYRVAQSFRDLQFEMYPEADLYSKLYLDSIKSQASPIFTIKTEDVDGNTKQISVYNKKLPKGSTDMAGNPIEYDNERLFAKLEDGRIVLIQHFVFGHILRPLISFKHPSS